MQARNALACLFLSSALSGDLLAQNIPARERGLLASSPYDYGQIDNVNVFNGNLTITIPIGQSYPVDGILSYALQLHYNSNVWEFEDVDSEIKSTPMDSLSMEGHTNAGIGWRMTLGEMVPPWEPPLNPGSNWMALHPHGGRSKFYNTLHDGDPTSVHRYTRDGTYLRWVDDTEIAYTFGVECPNGITQIYEDNTGRLVRIEDPRGNWLAIAYPNSLTQELTDKHGRTHYIYLRPDAPGKKMIDRVDLETFGGARAL